MTPGRVMVIGAVGSGKTTLVMALAGERESATKTQAIEYRACTIDTPGEFAENPFYYRALFATSMEADTVLFVQDSTREYSIWPPGFAGAFPRRTLGVVTKIDHPQANVIRAREALAGLGLKGPVVAVSAVTGEGIGQLRQLLERDAWD